MQQRRAVSCAELTIWLLWLGGLWSMALLVAPALFKWLPRADAGVVAGRLFLFHAKACIAVPLLLLLLARVNHVQLQLGPVLALVLVSVIGAVGVFYIQPLMNELRVLMIDAQPDALPDLKRQFGRLHAVSSVLFAVQMLSGLWWGWRRFLPRPLVHLS